MVWHVLWGGMTTARHPLSRHIGSGVLIVILIFIAVAQEVLIPLTLAALFAMMLTPVVTFLVRNRVPNLPAVLGVVSLATVAISFTGWLIFGQLNDLALHVPEYRDNLRHRVSELRTRGKGVSAVAETMQDLKKEFSVAAPVAGQAPSQTIKPLVVTVDNPPALNFSDFMAMAISSLQPLAIVVLTLLLATFMMAQREDLHRRYMALTTRMAGKGIPVLSQQALDEVTGKITRYLVLQSLTNLAAGTIVAVALFFLGLPNALLWGLLTALLRYVPYVGVFLVTTMACVFAVAVSPDWNLPLMVAGLFFLVEVLIGNVAEPIFFAQGTGLSTLAVLVATAFWTWIWGPAGMVLAIPLTVCLVAVGKYVPSLNYLHILLAKQPDDLEEV